MRFKFDAKDSSSKLNELRLRLGNHGISETSFRKELKNAGLSSSVLFWNEFVRVGIVEKADDMYRFSSPKTPIHYTKLQTAYTAYKDKSERYYKKYKSKKDCRKKYNEVEISKAIKILVENGFQIYAPVGSLYAKL